MRFVDEELSQDLTIAGVAVRTRPATAAADLAALWQRFYAEGVAARVGGPDATVHAVYCEYESDHGGAYTAILGVPLPAGAALPPGLRAVRVPAGRYARFDAEGPPAEVLWRAWAEINGAWERTHRRRYEADFERYRAASPERVEVEIWVGAA